MQFIGLDQHKHYSIALKIDSVTGVRTRQRLIHDREAYQRFIGNEPTTLVLEAGRT